MSTEIPTTIVTNTGHSLDFTNPEAYEFDIEGIAKALSKINRFTGQTIRPVNVAAHSLFCSALVPGPFKLATLMHDAPEAFIGDVAKPLKQLLPDYQAIESRVESAVFNFFGIELTPQAEEAVKQADYAALLFERIRFLRNSADWSNRECQQELDELTIFDMDHLNRLAYYYELPMKTVQKKFVDEFTRLKLWGATGYPNNADHTAAV